MRLLGGRWIHQCPHCGLLWAVKPPGDTFLCWDKTDTGCKQESALQWPAELEEITQLHEASGVTWHPSWSAAEYEQVIADESHTVGT